jgi:general secretion pathway protein D
VTGKTMMWKYLRVLAAAAALFATAATLEGRTRKGDKYYKDAEAAAAKKDWDAAVDLYQKAVDEDPKDSSYLIGMRKARFEAGALHVEQGRALRSKGMLEQAAAEFERAIIIDPSSAVALQELKRTQDMLGQAPDSAAARGLTPIEQARREDDELFSRMEGPPELKPAIQKVPMLKINNQPWQRVYESICKIFGINLVVDPQPGSTPNRNIDVELTDATVDQALDFVALKTHTFWKPVSSNTVFVTDDSTNKRRDYEDWVVKTFYVTNVTSAQEFTEIATAVRTIANIRTVFTVAAQKAMVVRGTADAVALAGKLIRDLDKPKPEVIVDVYIMEANSARTRDLAATIVNAATAGLNVPISFTRGTSTTAAGGGANGGAATGTPVGTIGLGSLDKLSLNDFTATLPGALLQAMLSDNRTKLLNQPQVRASDGQKVQLKIGDQVPIATGTFSTAVGTVGGFPSANTQFQFKDVGITVEVTPQVHSADDVSMHVLVEVSAVKSYQDVGGVKQPLIGTRHDETDIRLREGEVSILGGLEGTQDSTVANGIPGLMSLPILGKFLFGSDHTENDKQELLIAMVPHIVRGQDYTRENLRTVLSGTDQVVKLSYAPSPEESGAGAQQAPAAEPPKPGSVPQGSPQGSPAIPPPAAARVQFVPGTLTVSANSPFMLNVQLQSVADALSVAPLKVKWDPALMRLTDITPGDLLTRDEGRVTSVKDIRNDIGEATLTITRAPGSSGISGSGPVATLNFVSLAKGSGTVNVTELGLKNSQNQAIPVALSSVPVTIQ